MAGGRLPPFVPSRPHPILVNGVPLRVDVPVYALTEPEAKTTCREGVDAPADRSVRAKPPHPFSAPRPKPSLVTA